LKSRPADFQLFLALRKKDFFLIWPRVGLVSCVSFFNTVTVSFALKQLDIDPLIFLESIK